MVISALLRLGTRIVLAHETSTLDFVSLELEISLNSPQTLSRKTGRKSQKRGPKNISQPLGRLCVSSKLVAIAAILARREGHVSSAIRRFVLAAGAAALLSAQTAHAAPAMSRVAIDPLVSLSVLGTAQSRAAVCAAGTSAALAGSALATQAVTPAPGCLLPVTAPAPPPPVTEAPPPPPPPRAGLGFNPLLALLGLAVLGGLAYLLLRDDDDDGDLIPISPA